jgi:hypothetical protein
MPARSLAALALAAILLPGLATAQEPPLASLQVADLGGAPHPLLPSPSRALVLLFWQPDHARARSALCEVSRLAVAEDTPVVTVVPGTYPRTEIEAASAACAVKPAALFVDPGRQAFSALRVVALPTVLVVDSDNTIRLRLASFGSEALGQLQQVLETIRGRNMPRRVAAPSEPPGAVSRLEMARRLFKLGMPAKAEEILSALTREHPAFRPAWVTLGYQRIFENNLAEAGKCFDAALNLDPGAIDVAPGLAWIWSKRGDRQQAARWARAADRRDPHYSIIERLNP